jgi:hypothetical protein
MAGTIATLLASSKVIPQTGAGLRGQNRHAYDELIDIQNQHDPDLASPYLLAAAVSRVSETLNATSGNFALTLNFPNYGVEVTTGNLSFAINQATLQIAIEAAMAGQTVVGLFGGGDIDVAIPGPNLNAAPATITANGSSVNGAHMIITTANVDLDVDEMSVDALTIGTMNRPAEATLAAFDVAGPVSDVTPQGLAPSEGDYTAGNNPLSMSPGLKDLLVAEIEMSEDSTLGVFIRGVVGCV